MKKTCAAFFFAFSTACLLLSISHAAEPDKLLRGQTFTNPSIISPMPDDWIKNPIKYEKMAERADLAIVMDQDIYYTLLPTIQKFGKDNKLKVVVKEGTCGIATGMLANKTTDMGGFCCPPGETDRLPGLKFHTMGIVAITFLVHPNNPVDNISTAQLRDIYRGKISRWSELQTKDGKPGPDLAIKTIGRLHCKQKPGHWRQLLDNEVEFSRKMFEVGSIPDMIAQVASSKDAIGWEVLTMVEKHQNLGKVKPLRIDGYQATDSEALKSLKYPFYRTYNLTTWESPATENKQALKLVPFMLKEFEKFNPDRYGFVSVNRLKKAGWKFNGNELVAEPK